MLCFASVKPAEWIEADSHLSDSGEDLVSFYSSLQEVAC